MNCEELARARLSDDPVDRRAFLLHARECPTCARLLADDEDLLDAVEAWKKATPAPSLSLERKIASALAATSSASAAGPRRAVWRWVAAAAVLIAALAGLPLLLDAPWSGTDPLALAILEVEDAEQAYVRAIARLEQRTSEVLASAGDPALPPDRASLLLDYQGRLAHLDAVLADVRGFLEENPGHTGGHTVLLAAYKEKATVMRELLELDRELGAAS